MAFILKTQFGPHFNEPELNTTPLIDSAIRAMKLSFGLRPLNSKSLRIESHLNWQNSPNVSLYSRFGQI